MTARHTGAEATMRAVAPAGIRSGKSMRETAVDFYGADRAAAGRHGDSGMRSQARRWIPKSEALAIDYAQRRVTAAGRAPAHRGTGGTPGRAPASRRNARLRSELAPGCRSLAKSGRLILMRRNPRLGRSLTSVRTLFETVIPGSV